MAVVPYSRVVNVTVTRGDNFPSRRGFGVPLFLQSKAVAGVLDATHLTKVYGSMAEVAVDFNSTDEAYKALATAFAQKPTPRQVKVGYYDATDEAFDADMLTDALDAIEDVDGGWWSLTVESSIRDDVPLCQAIANWTESKAHVAIIESNDPLMKNPADATNVAAVLKATEYEQTAIVYHDHAAEYPAIALAAKISTYDLDADDSAYTPAFKKLANITRNNIGSAALQAITGFVPGLGQDKTQGHLATVYVDIGSQNHTQFGSVMKVNTFIDEIHFGHWLKGRTEEEMFALLLNNSRVPFDDNGMTLLSTGPETVCNRAAAAGFLAADVDDETGEFSPPFKIVIPRALSVPASQRKTRVSPPIQIYFRYAGAVHYAQAAYNVSY